MGRDNDDIERDLAESDGLRPDEDAGPDQCEASPRRCDFRQGERMSGPTDAQFSMTDQLHDEFPIEPIPVVMAEDGLPKPVTSDPQDATAIPFTYETQLCIEDDREYIELTKEDLWAREWDLLDAPRGEPSTWLTPKGTRIQGVCVRSRFDEDGLFQALSAYKPEEVEERWGHHFIKDDEGWRPVRPRRERCKHYFRQVFSNDSQKDPALPMHQIVFRLCKARRSNGGAYMSLSNEAVYVCDVREPFDVPTSRLQDRKDKKKLVDRPDLLKLPLFNLAGDSVQVENKTS